MAAPIPTSLLLLILLLSLLVLGSCGSAGAKLYGGYTQMQLSGTVALDTSAGGVPLGTIQADFEDDLGLGDEVGSPYLRAEIDLGTIVLTGSGFVFEESGTGMLSVDFGDITAGALVDTKIDILNVKVAITFDLVDFGPLRLSPGVAVDTFNIDMNVETIPAVSSERLEIFVPVPMLFLQGELALGPVGATVDVGWMDVDLQDVDGTWWDIEGLARFNILPAVEIFAGYRYISVDSDGDADGQAFSMDLELEGWMLGAGIVW